MTQLKLLLATFSASFALLLPLPSAGQLLPFGALTTGTNTAATMTVGSGASLGPAGTGTVTSTGAQTVSPDPSACTAAFWWYNTSNALYKDCPNGVPNDISQSQDFDEYANYVPRAFRGKLAQIEQGNPSSVAVLAAIGDSHTAGFSMDAMYTLMLRQYLQSTWLNAGAGWLSANAAPGAGQNNPAPPGTSVMAGGSVGRIPSMLAEGPRAMVRTTRTRPVTRPAINSLSIVESQARESLVLKWFYSMSTR